MGRKKKSDDAAAADQGTAAAETLDESFDTSESDHIGPQPGVPIVLPLTGEEPVGFIGQHLDVRLTIDQGRALKKLTAGLNGRRLKTGRFVKTGGDSVRWILEQLIAAGPGA